MKYFEEEYLSLLGKILHLGNETSSRTGQSVKKMTGASFTIPLESLSLNTFVVPKMTHRPTAFRIAALETLMFLKGITDTKWLEDQGVNIWKGNTTREFLDSRGMHEYPEGSLGKGYSYQWRNFNGVDQISEMIERMEKDPFDRRHLFSAWNPSELDEMALPPCHLLNMYTIIESSGVRFVDSSFVMRSSDVVFGLPYNIMSYAFLNFLICLELTRRTGIEHKPRALNYFAQDAHVYESQYEYARAILEDGLQAILDSRPEDVKEMKDEIIRINNDRIFEVEWEDIEVVQKGETLGELDIAKPPMAV